MKNIETSKTTKHMTPIPTSTPASIPTSIPPAIADAPEWAQDIFQSLPCLASYDDIGRASRMNRGTIANFHSEGRGPKGSVLLGKKRVFPRLEVVRWLMEMAEKAEV